MTPSVSASASGDVSYIIVASHQPCPLTASRRQLESRGVSRGDVTEVDVSYDVEAQARVVRETGRTLDEAPFVYELRTEGEGARAIPLGTAEDLARCIQSGLLATSAVSTSPPTPSVDADREPAAAAARTASTPVEFFLNAEPNVAADARASTTLAPAAAGAGVETEAEGFDVVHVNWFRRPNPRRLLVSGGQLVRTKRTDPTHRNARPLSDVTAVRRRAPLILEIAFRDASTDTYTFSSAQRLDAFLNALLLAGCASVLLT